MTERTHDARNRPINRRMQEHDDCLQRNGIDIFPWAGGTWGGNCGAAHYFEGSPPTRQTFTSRTQWSTFQAWAERNLIPGYWAECDLPHRHQFSHSGAGKNWPRTDLMRSIGDVYSPWATN